MRVLFVQESIEDCLQEDSDYFADAFPSAALLFLKNDWELNFFMFWPFRMGI